MVRTFKPSADFLGADAGANLLFQLTLILLLLFLFIVGKFGLFHVNLILENKTTIGNLQYKNQEYTSTVSRHSQQYDLGACSNVRQVFGSLYWTYPFPFYLASGLPHGDGITWVTRADMLDEDEASSPDDVEAVRDSSSNGRRPFGERTPTPNTQAHQPASIS